MLRLAGLRALPVSMLLGALQPAMAADPPGQPPVPVQTAGARIQDVPVLLSGLGTVQPLNAVQIRAQVNGTLIALPVQEGQEVHAGDVLAEIDPRPYQAALDQAMAQRDEDSALLQSAQLDLKRYQDLAKSQFAPRQQVDDQQATVNKQIAAIALDNAQIETAQINLGYCVIKAPFDGRVGFYQVTVGNLVQAASQTTILTLTETSPIAVVFTLPEADLPQVEQALARGSAPVEAFDSSNGQKLASGTLLTPNNMIDTASGTISLKATFRNEDDHLWAGQFVDTRIQVGTLPHTVTVPVLSVNHGPDGAFVYVVDPDSIVRQANVSVGMQWNDWQVVTKGLSGDETIVVGGQSRIAPGVPVKAAPEPANTAAPT